MNDKTEDFNKSELIKNLESLYDLEIKKSIETIDTDLLDETIAFGLELNELEVTLTPEEIEEKVRKIPFVETATLNTTQESVNGKTTKVKSHKILLIAAIISILVTIFAITSIAFDWNIFDELKNRFGTVADTPVNEDIDVNGITVISRGESKTYKSLDDIVNKYNLKILYPIKTPDGITLKSIMIYQTEKRNEFVFLFNNNNFTFTISPNTMLSNNIKNGSTEILEINNMICYITDMTDIGATQLYFEYDNDLYMLRYNNKQGLIEIIDNLKELQ